MADGYADNLTAVLDSWDEEMPSKGTYELKMANVMEYAKYLQDKHGYYVFNDQITAQAVYDWIKDLVESSQDLTDENIEQALEGAGYEVMNVLTSLTGQTRPPVKEGEGPRQAHPGSWADITRNLANAYRFQVENEDVKEAEYSEPTESKPEVSFP